MVSETCQPICWFFVQELCPNEATPTSLAHLSSCLQKENFSNRPSWSRPAAMIAWPGSNSGFTIENRSCKVPVFQQLVVDGHDSQASR